MTNTSSDEATVLVVDDEHPLAELYTNFLAPEYDVRMATSGSEALQQYDEAVDVIVLDRRMRDMSGDEVLDQIRDRSADVQVMMATAVEPTEDIVEMPFDDYKVKPLTKADLLGAVDTLLTRATYDERSQELFALASKKASLEMANNTNTEEYDQLVERMQEVRAEVEDTLDELDPKITISELSKG